MNTGKKLFLCAGLLAFFLSVSAQSYSLRTNVIGLATDQPESGGFHDAEP